MEKVKPAWKLREPPAVGSRWDNTKWGLGTVRVMAVVEGHVMYRRKGAAPCVCHLHDWFSRFVLKPVPPPNPKVLTDE